MLFNLTSERGNGHDFTIDMSSSTNFEAGNYEIALISAMVNYGWHNISSAIGNNILKYRITAMTEWIETIIPDGTYGVSALDSYLKSIMRTAGHYNAGTDERATATTDDIYYLSITGNESTGKIVINVSNNYQIDLSASLIYQTLGYNAETILSTNANHEAPNTGDFNRNVNQIQIRTNLLHPQASNVNGKPAQVIYAFNPFGMPYSFMNVVPSVPIYLPMNGRSISSINIKITDQDGNKLTTANERTSVVLNVRKVQ